MSGRGLGATGIKWGKKAAAAPTSEQSQGVEALSQTQATITPGQDFPFDDMEDVGDQSTKKSTQKSQQSAVDEDIEVDMFDSLSKVSGETEKKHEKEEEQKDEDEEEPKEKKVKQEKAVKKSKPATAKRSKSENAPSAALKRSKTIAKSQDFSEEYKPKRHKIAKKGKRTRADGLSKENISRLAALEKVNRVSITVHKVLGSLARRDVRQVAVALHRLLGYKKRSTVTNEALMPAVKFLRSKDAFRV